LYQKITSVMLTSVFIPLVKSYVKEIVFS